MTPIIDLKHYVLHRRNTRAWFERHAEAIKLLPILVALIVILCVVGPSL